MYVESRKVVKIISFAKQKQHRCREQMDGSQGERVCIVNWEMGSDVFIPLVL